MSESPAPNPASVPPRRRVRTRAASAKSANGAGPFDKLMIVAGVVLLAFIGFVAYRTQVQGLPIEAAIPFFSADEHAENDEGGAAGPGGERFPGDVPDPSRRRAVVKKDGAGAEYDENNTFFGRRERGVRRPSANVTTPPAEKPVTESPAAPSASQPAPAAEPAAAQESEPAAE